MTQAARGLQKGKQNIRLDDPDGRRSDDRAPHLAPRRRKQKTQRLTDKLPPRAGGAASMMQNQVTGKAPIAVPVPTDTTGLTEVEALTFKNDHQNGAGNRLTLNERG